MKFFKLFFVFLVVSSYLNSSQINPNDKNEIVEHVGTFLFKGRKFQANKLIIKNNTLTLDLKFKLMEELLNISNQYKNSDCMIFIESLSPDKDIEYCVTYLSPSRALSPKMYFYEKAKDTAGYGLGRPIVGVSAEGDDGDFCYNDQVKTQIEYPKNDQGIMPTYKFPNFGQYCEENGSPDAFKNIKIDSIYNSLKNWTNRYWKPSQVRDYNSAINACRAIMYQSYLKMENIEDSFKRNMLIAEDCIPKMKLFLSSLNDMEVGTFILAEFEFWKWDLSDIYSRIWLMTVIYRNY